MNPARTTLLFAPLLLSSLVGCERPEPTEQASPPRASATASAATTAPTKPPPPVEALELRTYDLAVQGDLVHAGTTAGVVTWSVSDPTHPKKAASLPLPGSVNRVAVFGPNGTQLAVATGPTGLVFLRTDKAGSGVLERMHPEPWSREARQACHAAWNFAASQPGRGYAACGGSGVVELELEDASSPQPRRSLAMGGYVRDVVVLDAAAGVSQPSGTKIAAAAGFAGLVIADFAGAGAPKALSTLPLPGEARALAVRQGHAYVAMGAAGLAVVDVRDAKKPALVGRFSPVLKDMARGIAVEGTLAFLCAGESGMFVIDVARPEAPKLLGRYDPNRALNRAVAIGNTVYTASDAHGLAILDVSNPAAPKLNYPPDSAAK